MKNIYLDFDGTIIDSSQRLYEVYKAIMTELSCGYLPKAEYWQLKRERQSYAEILSKTAAKEKAKEFNKRFVEKVESIDFLRFDKLLDGAFQALTALRENNRLVLVTLRRSRENLFWELKQLGIFDFFADIFADFKEGEDSWKIAASSIKKDRQFNRGNSVLIGDTEDTVLAGKELGITSFLVLSGIRSESFLKKYGFGYIVKDISEIPGYLLDGLNKELPI